jgi:hypothetical protein
LAKEGRPIMKLTSLTLFAVATAVILCGCDKSSSSAAESTGPSSSSAPTIARIHWLGKKQIAAETNSAGLMRIWNEPESARLEAQTLDKLSTAPWRLFKHVATTNTASAKLLRPLLDDCVLHESYLEIRCATNQPGELAFAIRVNAGRAALWKTNLAAVLESLTGISTTPVRDGWQLKKHEVPNLIELDEAGDWVLVGIGQEKNALLADFRARIRRGHAPFVAAATNFWVDVSLDLRRIAGSFALNWSLPADFPSISMASVGDGEKIHTSGQLIFPAPLPISLPAWAFPTNLIQWPLVGLTAVRGINPLLSRLKPFSLLPSNAVPNQLFEWELLGTPPPLYIAMPVSDPTNTFNVVAGSTVQWLNLALPHVFGSVTNDPNACTLAWNGMPFGSPSLQTITNGDRDYFLGGFIPYFQMKESMPGESLARILGGTNLVFFDLETTGTRLNHWMYLDSIFRTIFDQRGPLFQQDSVAVQWFTHNLGTNLSECVTEARLAAPNRLTFIRDSTVGLTALELHFLVNWVETPEFPYGFQTFLVTNPLPVDLRPRIRRRPVTNAPAANPRP